MMKSEQKKPVTLEDLLRLKRLERPPGEFWGQFERELRAKQLAAIVARRPWWSEFPRRIFSGFSRYSVPLGATAVLALTFVSIRHYQPSENGAAPAASLNAISVQPDQLASDIEREAPGASSLQVSTSPLVAVVSGSIDSTKQSAGDQEDRFVSDSSALSGDVSAMNALLGVSASPERERSIASTSVPLPGATFASLPPLDASVASAKFAEKRGFENRVLPARNTDPLATVTPPDRVRNKRFQPAASFPVTTPARVASTRSSDRIINSVSERLYESESRYGFTGNKVMAKW